MRRQRDRQQRRAKTGDAEDERAGEGDQREYRESGRVGGAQRTVLRAASTKGFRILRGNVFGVSGQFSTNTSDILERVFSRTIHPAHQKNLPRGVIDGRNSLCLFMRKLAVEHAGGRHEAHCDAAPGIG